MIPTPLPSATSTSSMQLQSAKKNYSAEWIDLLSPKSYSSTSSISSPGVIEPPRSGAVSFSTPNNDKLFTFAGYAEIASTSPNVPPERFVVNDLWKFTPYQEESSAWGWTKVVPNNNEVGAYIPGPRLATAGAVLHTDDNDSSSFAVLLGGWDPQVPGTGGIILEDVSMLDLDSLQWSKCTTENEKESTVPGGPTSRHVAVPLSIKNDSGSVDNVCLHNHRCEDHVLIMSTDGDNGKHGKWKQQPTTGDAPSSRGLHCAAPLATASDKTSKAMVIFGGAAQEGIMSNEAFALDTNTWKWVKIDCSADGDDIPSPRAGAQLCQLDENSVLLFGGATPGDGGLLGLNDVWILHIDLVNGKGKWECLVSNGDDDAGEEVCRPPGRNAHTLSAIDAANMLPKDLVWKEDLSAGCDGEDCSYFLLQVSYSLL